MMVCVDMPLNVATVLKEGSQTHGLVFMQFAERPFLFCYLLYSEILCHSPKVTVKRT